MKINKYHFQVLVVEAGLLLLAGLVTFVVVWVRTVQQKHRADAFLQDVLKLEVGKSTLEEALKLAQKFGAMPWYVNSDDMRCTYQRCELRFVFENRPLTSVHLVRYVELIGTVSVKNGLVVGRELDYGREAGRYEEFEYGVMEHLWSQEDHVPRSWIESGMWRLKVREDGIPRILRVTIGPTSTPDQRKRAYALDLSCLDNLFGCNNPAAMFPPGIAYRGTAFQTHSNDW
ncbi:MAG TPA: hypothetical protein VJY15_05070 [Candidatus Acidoferrum sp.]|nr:hypothetical protein [Candidatus Acidoferrum sp.]